VWYLGATDLAASFRRYAGDLIRAGVGDWPTVSNELTVACMAALLGDHDEADAYFERARQKLVLGAHEPQRAIIDFDHAVALSSRHGDERARSLTLLDEARRTFARLEMRGWEKRAVAEALRQESSPAGRGRAVAPGEAP
jgi:hypothetical protein